MKIIDWGGPKCTCGWPGRFHLEWEIYQTETKWAVRCVRHFLPYYDHMLGWSRWRKTVLSEYRRYFPTREKALAYLEGQRDGRNLRE